MMVGFSVEVGLVQNYAFAYNLSPGFRFLNGMRFLGKDGLLDLH
jgi:hypothetical protein